MPDPKNTTQRKIKEMIARLRNQNGSISETSIYAILEDFFPFMSDEDMYFADKILRMPYGNGPGDGTFIIGGLRLCKTGSGSYGQYQDLGDVSYTRCRATQFSEWDNSYKGESMLAAAIKLVNPNYSENGDTLQTTAVYSVACCVNDGAEQCRKEISVTMAGDEYSKVVYVPLETVGNIEGLGYGVADFKIVLYENGVGEAVESSTFKFLNTPMDMAAACNIFADPYGVNEKSSFINMRKHADGDLCLCLCTVKFKDYEKPQEIELAMRVAQTDSLEPDVACISYIKLQKMEDLDVYVYEGPLFKCLEGVEDMMFQEGMYEICFHFMEHELIYSKVVVSEGDMCVHDNERPFYTTENWGVICDVDDFIAGRAETMIDESRGNEDDEDDIDDFERLLDEFIQKDYDELYNEDSNELPDEDSCETEGKRPVTGEFKVYEGSMCAGTEEEYIRIIKNEKWFFIRPGDTHIHMRFTVSNTNNAKDIVLLCLCKEPGGKLARKKVEIYGSGWISETIPLDDLHTGLLDPGTHIAFEFSLQKGDREFYRGECTGYVIDSIFEVVDLASVDLFNEGPEDNYADLENMVGFSSSKMDTLHIQYGVKLQPWMRSLTTDMRAVLIKPDGNKLEEEVIQCANVEGSETDYFRVSFERSSVGNWAEGRYGVAVFLRDSKEMCDDFINLTFSVGDWDMGGSYDVKRIKREILEKNKARQQEKEKGEEMSALDKLHSMIGLGQVKKEIEELRQQLEMAKTRKMMGLPADMPFLHARFYGNPGTGKTTVAKLLGQIYKDMGLLSSGHIVFAERKTLIAGRWYDSANVATMEAIDKAQGGILFIDEAYNLAVPEDPKDPGQDIISSLLTALSDESKKDWMLILAGYPDKMETMMTQNDGFKSRVPNVFHFYDYTPDELLQIAHKYCKEHVYTLTPEAEEHLKIVIGKDYAKRGKNFDNGRYVINLLETNVIKRMGKRLSGVPDISREALTTILPDDIPSIIETRKSSKLDKLNNMIGLTQLKESIQNHLNYVKLCNNRMMAGLSSQMPPLHMVFTGNPGTGKTTVADFMGEIYASMGILSEGNVLKYTKKDLVGYWIGDTEKTLRELFKRVKGNVLFIDEAYELNPHGDEKDRGRIILDALVDELGTDNADMIVILAGYQKEMEVLMEYNPGLKSRFPNVFHFNDYSVEELMKIALSSKVAEGFVFTPTAKQRLEAYIRREVLKKQKGFGNGRFVNRLLSGTVLPRMATRLAQVENPTQKQLQTIVAEDIPITAEEARSVCETGFNEKLISEALAKLDALVGLQKVKQAIHNFVDVARYRNSIGEKFVGSDILKWSFTGNSGTGKSTVAMIFADILKGMNLLAKGNFVEVKGEQIFNVSEHTCDEVLKSAVDRSRYGMLFIDGDAPELKERGSYALTNDQLKIKLMELTAEHGGAGAIVVAECSAKRQALVSSMTQNGVYEFDHTFVFDDYTPSELYQILAQCLAAHKVRFTPEAETYIGKYIKEMFEDKGQAIANARTMKLLSRTIYEVIMLRESRKPGPPRRTVCLCDVEKFVWERTSGRLGYRK